VLETLFGDRRSQTALTAERRAKNRAYLVAAGVEGSSLPKGEKPPEKAFMARTLAVLSWWRS
jgi:hypothetical protein